MFPHAPPPGSTTKLTCVAGHRLSSLVLFFQDNDIDDIMSTFGPVSIRTGREDILFGPQDEESLPMFDRIIGKARDAASGRPGGKGDGASNSTGGGGSGGGARDSTASRGRSGAGAGGIGGKTAGGIRGRSSAGAQGFHHKKPTAPPPAYSSLPRPREAPLAVPLGGGAERGGGGRSTQPARGVPGRGTRRGESAPRLLGDSQSGGRRALSGAPSLQPRKGETRYERVGGL